MADAERSAVVAAVVDLQGKVPTRLQSRAPTLIETTRPLNWNVTIPLLTPLVSPSPCGNSGPDEGVLMAENLVREDPKDKAKWLSFTKWQHPAAPFYYWPDPRAPFVPA